MPSPPSTSQPSHLQPPGLRPLPDLVQQPRPGPVAVHEQDGLRAALLAAARVRVLVALPRHVGHLTHVWAKNLVGWWWWVGGVGCRVVCVCAWGGGTGSLCTCAGVLQRQMRSAHMQCTGDGPGSKLAGLLVCCQCMPDCMLHMAQLVRHERHHAWLARLRCHLQGARLRRPATSAVTQPCCQQGPPAFLPLPPPSSQSLHPQGRSCHWCPPPASQPPAGCLRRGREGRRCTQLES